MKAPVEVPLLRERKKGGGGGVKEEERTTAEPVWGRTPVLPAFGLAAHLPDSATCQAQPSGGRGRRPVMGSRPARATEQDTVSKTQKEVGGGRC